MAIELIINTSVCNARLGVGIRGELRPPRDCSRVVPLHIPYAIQKL